MKKAKLTLALALLLCAAVCLFSCGEADATECTSHVYDNDCDATCNNQGCDHVREVEHKFDHDCDPDCNTEGCGFTREVEHVYDNVCDKTCNVSGCKAKRTVEHVYDNECDEYCNTEGCRETRTVTHVYDDECDTVCNVNGCGATRTVPHVYDHAYDTVCNNSACGYERTVKGQSVLLIGQSNMAGRGDLGSVEPIDDDRILMLKNNQWVKMQEPIHSDKTSAGVGLSASFAKAFVESFDCELGLIPAAVGGTSLNDWEKGGSLYREAVRLARIAMEDSEICAILWHQGEADQNSKEYAKKLKVILDSMLADLGLDKNKIVIITGELFGTRSDAVHRDQLNMLASYYPNYGVAESDGLTVFDVTTHFDSPSLRVFGYRYFAIFYKCITKGVYTFDDDPNSYLIK
jgi:hypothetical protein